MKNYPLLTPTQILLVNRNPQAFDRVKLGEGKRTGDFAWRNFAGIPVQVCMNRGKRTLEQSRAKSEKSVAKNNRIYRTL